MGIAAQQLRLFSGEMRDAMPRQQVVMDFVERYFMDLEKLDRTTAQTRMADDKVYFRQGNPRSLRTVTDTTDCSISLVDRHYEVTWAADTVPIATVVFPAQYDLILGMPQNEIQKRLEQYIRDAAVRTDSVETPALTEELDGGIWVAKSEMMELESLNDATYYNMVEERAVPVFDGAHQDYSAANLFHGLIADRDYRMYVEQSVYGMSTTGYSLMLGRWLDYCAEQGLKVFFAVEEEREDGLLAMVIAQSRELCYNHLLSVVIPDGFVDNPNAVLKVRLTPYIPTHNVKDLYQKQTIKTKKKVW